MPAARMSHGCAWRDRIPCQDKLRARPGYRILPGPAARRAADWAGGKSCLDPVSQGGPGQPGDRRFSGGSGGGRKLGRYLPGIHALSGQASPERDDHPLGQYLVAWRHVRFPLAAVGNHGWETGGEAGLIHVALLAAQLGTGLPAYSRCCPGKAIGVPGPVRAVTGLAIMDAGHNVQDDIAASYGKASFVGGPEGKPGIMPWFDGTVSGPCLEERGSRRSRPAPRRHAAGTMRRVPC